MANGQFVLGVGAQKSGTTWVSKYLDSFTHTDSGFTKEYHIWDALTHPQCKRFNTPLYKVRSRNNFQRWRMLRNPDNYFAYFETLLAQPGISLTSDITPSYSCLNADTLAKIKQEFEKKQIQVKVIFLMRDPFERCWSAIRHYKRNESNRDGVRVDQSDAKALERYASSESCAIRTRYQDTITALEQVFDNRDVYYGIYENLFSRETITRLSEFLDLEIKLEMATLRVNVSQKQEVVPDKLIDNVREVYADTYAFCQKRFPEVNKLWRGLQISQPVRRHGRSDDPRPYNS